MQKLQVPQQAGRIVTCTNGRKMYTIHFI